MMVIPHGREAFVGSETLIIGSYLVDFFATPIRPTICLSYKPIITSFSHVDVSKSVRIERRVFHLVLDVNDEL